LDGFAIALRAAVERQDRAAGAVTIWRIDATSLELTVDAVRAKPSDGLGVANDLATREQRPRAVHVEEGTEQRRLPGNARAVVHAAHQHSKDQLPLARAVPAPKARGRMGSEHGAVVEALDDDAVGRRFVAVGPLGKRV